MPGAPECLSCLQKGKERLPRGEAVEMSLGKLSGVYEIKKGRVLGEGIAARRNSTRKGLETR